ncbi:DNA mismatch repair protein Mlh3-like [Watersipora subatra]|uniref:DNA mismatch repair protein Mlh3-like n=1 Tax=Watersipora subatra TaxID=2589382 RepID=UPI00355B2397
MPFFFGLWRQVKKERRPKPKGLPIFDPLQSSSRAPIPSFTLAKCVEDLLIAAIDSSSNCISIRVNIVDAYIQVVDNGEGLDKTIFHKLGKRELSVGKGTAEKMIKSALPSGATGTDVLRRLLEICEKVEIVSRSKNETDSMSLCKNFSDTAGKVTKSTKERPCAGTTVTIHNPFYKNSNSRKEINESKELQDVVLLVQGLAVLFAGKISMSLRDECRDKVLINTSNIKSMKEAVLCVFGIEYCNQLHTLKASCGSIQVAGVVSTVAYPGKKAKIITLNHRQMSSRRIQLSVDTVLKASKINFSNQCCAETAVSVEKNYEVQPIIERERPDKICLAAKDKGSSRSSKPPPADRNLPHVVYWLLKRVPNLVPRMDPPSVDESLLTNQMSMYPLPGSSLSSRYSDYQMLSTDNESFESKMSHHGMGVPHKRRRIHLGYNQGNQGKSIFDSKLPIPPLNCKRDEVLFPQACVTQPQMQSRRRKLTEQCIKSPGIPRERAWQLRTLKGKVAAKNNEGNMAFLDSNHSQHSRRHCLTPLRRSSSFTPCSYHYYLTHPAESLGFAKHSYKHKLNTEQLSKKAFHDHFSVESPKSNHNYREEDLKYLCKKSPIPYVGKERKENNITFRGNMVCDESDKENIFGDDDEESHRLKGSLRIAAVDQIFAESESNNWPFESKHKESSEFMTAGRNSQESIDTFDFGLSQTSTHHPLSASKNSTESEVIISCDSIVSGDLNTSLPHTDGLANHWSFEDVFSFNTASTQMSGSSPATQMCGSSSSIQMIGSSSSTQMSDSCSNKMALTAGCLSSGMIASNDCFSLSPTATSLSAAIESLSPNQLNELVRNNKQSDNATNKQATPVKQPTAKFQSGAVSINGTASISSGWSEIAHEIEWKPLGSVQSSECVNSQKQSAESAQGENTTIGSSNSARRIPKPASCSESFLLHGGVTHGNDEKIESEVKCQEQHLHSSPGILPSFPCSGSFSPRSQPVHIRELSIMMSSFTSEEFNILNADLKLLKPGNQSLALSSKLSMELLAPGYTKKSIVLTSDLLLQPSVIGQWGSQVILLICKTTTPGDEVIIAVDQHAAHERIRVELLRRRYIDKSGQVLSSPLPLPQSLKLSKAVADFLSDSNSFQLLIRHGIHLELEEEALSVLVTAVPLAVASYCTYNERYTKTYVESVMIELMERGATTVIVSRSLQDVINSQACRGAIKFGDELNQTQCSALISCLSRCKLPFQCAHGRPSAVPIYDMTALKKACLQQQVKAPRLSSIDLKKMMS